MILSPPAFASRSAHRRSVTRLSLLATLALLGACGKEPDPAATQIAAKVGKGEISVHQINYVLQRQANLKPEQVDLASREILDRLVDQEAAVQKSIEMKLDREPSVVQSIEAARREILARAYVERVGASVSKPTDQEIQAYYDSKPALFKERRVYTFAEYFVKADQAQANALQEQMKVAKSVPQVIEWAKQQGMAVRDARNTTTAEALPLSLLDRFAGMKAGQAMVIPGAGVIRFILLENAVSEPKTLAQAKPAIEQYLGNESKRKAVDADIKALRVASQVEYTPKFAKLMETSASAPSGAAVPVPVAATPAEVAAPAAVPASGGQVLSTDQLGKGLSGLK
jgi:EpsD family peptidyl-prolyl cis-trans isomerase